MHVDSRISLYYIAIGAVNGRELYKIFGFRSAGIRKGNGFSGGEFVGNATNFAALVELFVFTKISGRFPSRNFGME